MRFESKVTSISWIPSEAIAGMMKLPFEMGVSRYDEPPPETIDDLEVLRLGDRFRFANVLRCWIYVEDGRIVGHDSVANLRTTLQLPSLDAVFASIVAEENVEERTRGLLSAMKA